MIKYLIVLLILFIVFSLGRGLFCLLQRDRDQLDVVKALTWRVGLSMGLFLFLTVAYFLGWIAPHSL